VAVETVRTLMRSLDARVLFSLNNYARQVSLQTTRTRVTPASRCVCLFFVCLLFVCLFVCLFVMVNEPCLIMRSKI
jgi:hypothetical protein